MVFLRNLLHIRFPNTIKLVIDAQSAGQGLLSLFAEPWEYKNSKGVIVEYPPLVSDSDEEAQRLPNANPIIRGIQAYANFNNQFYPYMKSCFEDGSLRLMTPSVETDETYRLEQQSSDPVFLQESLEKQLVHIEHDQLISELSNIRQESTDSTHKIIYTAPPDSALLAISG